MIYEAAHYDAASFSLSSYLKFRTVTYLIMYPDYNTSLCIRMCICGI